MGATIRSLGRWRRDHAPRLDVSTWHPARLIQRTAPETLTLPQRLLVGAWLTFKHGKDAEVPVRAAATAYTLVFSLIPLLTTTIAFVTAFPGLRGQRRALLDDLFQYLLPSAVSEVQGYIAQFSDRAAQAGTVSSVVFVAIVLVVFQGLERNFNLIWKVERSRTWGARLQVLAVFFLVGAVAATLMVTAMQQWASISARMARNELVDLPLLGRFFLRSADIVAAWAVFVVANRVLPNTQVRTGPAILGGVVAGTAWYVLKDAFTWYINNFASYENIYGTLGIIPAFFLWVYLSVVLLLAGGYISFVAQNLDSLLASRRFADVEEQTLAFYGVLVMGALARAFRNGEPPLGSEDLAERLGISTYFVDRSVPRLSRSNLILVLGANEAERYTLARPAESITVRSVVEAINGPELHLPQGAPMQGLNARVAEVFERARSQEAGVLTQVSVAQLEDAVGAPTPG